LISFTHSHIVRLSELPLQGPIYPVGQTCLIDSLTSREIGAAGLITWLVTGICISCVVLHTYSKENRSRSMTDSRASSNGAAGLGDVLLKPDIFKCLVAYIDADDVRGVSLLDCAISDTQYLRPRFLHMLGCGELVLNGLEKHKYKYNTLGGGGGDGNEDLEMTITRTDDDRVKGYPKVGSLPYIQWLVCRNVSVTCLYLKAPAEPAGWLEKHPSVCRWVCERCMWWQHVVLSGGALSIGTVLQTRQLVMSRLESIVLLSVWGDVSVSAVEVVLALARCPLLRSVAIHGRAGLVDIKPFASYSQLRYVYLADCDGLSDLSPLAECPLLESVECAGSTRITDVSYLGACSKLRKFVSTGTGHVDGIEALSKEIEFLDLACVTDADMVVLSHFSNLRVVSLGFDSEDEPDIRPLGQCSQLRCVQFDGESDVRDVTALGACRHLTHFFSGENERRILGIGALSSTLECVQLSCATNEDAQVLGTFSNLRKVNFLDSDLDEVSSLGLCTLLESFIFVGCYGIRDISALGSCPRLKRFENRYGRRLVGIERLSRGLESIALTDVSYEDITTLATFPLLRDVWLHDAESTVSDIHPLAHCAQLESISLRSCFGLTDISALASLRLLRRIKILFCRNLIDMSALGACSNLESLVIHSCRAVSDLSWIYHCSRLKSVNFSDCKGISDLSALVGCARLTDITLSSCHKVMDISFINRCAKLESIQFWNCPDIPDPIYLVGGLGQSIAFRRPV
jgi:hypothetical protein